MHPKESVTIKINSDMTPEDKQLLVQDLCARLPYEPKARKGGMETNINLTTLDSFYYGDEIILPYLRPMSSMTEDEKEELRNIIHFGYPSDDYDKYGHRGIEVANVRYDDWKNIEFDFEEFYQLEDWLNAHHFDYNGLIGKGLALKAPDGMYNKQNN